MLWQSVGKIYVLGLKTFTIHKTTDSKLNNYVWLKAVNDMAEPLTDSSVSFIPFVFVV